MPEIFVDSLLSDLCLIYTRSIISYIIALYARHIFPAMFQTCFPVSKRPACSNIICHPNFSIVTPTPHPSRTIPAHIFLTALPMLSGPEPTTATRFPALSSVTRLAMSACQSGRPTSSVAVGTMTCTPLAPTS